MKLIFVWFWGVLFFFGGNGFSVVFFKSNSMLLINMNMFLFMLMIGVGYFLVFNDFGLVFLFLDWFLSVFNLLYKEFIIKVDVIFFFMKKCFMIFFSIMFIFFLDIWCLEFWFIFN